jgi:predicted phosphoribosyltransferase
MDKFYIEREFNGIVVKIPVTFDEIEKLYDQFMDATMKEVEEMMRKEREAGTAEVTYP